MTVVSNLMQEKRKKVLISNPQTLTCVACLQAVVAVFIVEKTGNSGVRDRRRHLGHARKSVWSE